MIVPAAFAHAIPDAFADAEAAPLLCAGAIGFRSLRLAGLEDGQSLGLTGFGASAHLVLKLVRHQFPDTRVFVFARSEEERAFARELGAAWAGDTLEPSPEPLARDHRHHPRLDADRRGAGEPRARRAAGHQRDPQGGRRQAGAAGDSTTPGTSGSRRRSRASPT